MTIADRLRQLRGERTQQDVADAAGITMSNYSALECGRALPKYTTLEGLSRAFDVPLEKLFHGVELRP